MSIEAQHPQVAEMLSHLQQFNSALDDQMRRTTVETFSATDETKTVNATVNGSRCLSPNGSTRRLPTRRPRPARPAMPSARSSSPRCRRSPVR